MTLICRKQVSFWKLGVCFLHKAVAGLLKTLASYSPLLWCCQNFRFLVKYNSMKYFVHAMHCRAAPFEFWHNFKTHIYVWICSRSRAQSSSAVRRWWMSTSPASSSPYTPTPSTFWTPPACWCSEDMTCRRKMEMGTERRPSRPDMHRKGTKTWTTSMMVSGAFMMRTRQWKQKTIDCRICKSKSLLVLRYDPLLVNKGTCGFEKVGSR